MDMTIREHRGEMEQKIIKLEGTLEKSELELKECNKQVIILKFHILNCLKINTIKIRVFLLLFVMTPAVVLPKLTLNSYTQVPHT